MKLTFKMQNVQEEDIYNEEFNRYIKLAKSLVEQLKQTAGNLIFTIQTKFLLFLFLYIIQNLINFSAKNLVIIQKYFQNNNIKNPIVYTRKTTVLILT